MNGLKMYMRLVSLFSLGALFFSACKPSTPAPTATITSNVLDNMVTFNVVSSNATSYVWSFGDGDSSIVTTSTLMTHTYQNYGTTYSVNLKIMGPGGEVSVATTITLSAQTQMEILTGGASLTSGQAWRISSATPIILANPDSILSVNQTYPAGFLTLLGLGKAYLDQYIFFSTGNYAINNVSGGALAGLSYCTVNKIPNVSTQSSANAGLTYATPFTPSIDLGFTFNPGSTLTVPVTTDGITSTNVTYKNVTTLNFSKQGFLGLLDFRNGCIVRSLSTSQMTVALFISNLPSTSAMAGKITNVLLVTFEPITQ